MTTDAADARASAGHGVPQGIPASGAGPVADLIASDPPPAFRSVASDLLDQALSEPRVHRTRVERWVDEPSTLHGGRWEWVEDV
jgi:hypothetical protein